MDWFKVFNSRQEAESALVKGAPQLVILGGRRICLIRYGDDTFRAVQDACTHNAVSLSKGRLNFQGEIVCPWHGYCFDTKTGRESAGRSRDLETYPVRIDDEGFFIGV